MELTVFKTDGSATERTVALDPLVFGVEPNDHAIWLDVRSAQANARQGTHKAKERSDVRGGGQKPWRQKGTGRARAGTIRSPIWIGGGTTFGPRPRSYNVRVNRKTKALARRSVLSYRAQADAIRVIEDFALEAPKTRAIANLLAALDLTDQKVLLLTGAHDLVLYKSGRNIPKVNVRDAASASTLDLMDASVIVLLEGALGALSNVLAAEASSAADGDDDAAAAEPGAVADTVAVESEDAPASQPVVLEPDEPVADVPAGEDLAAEEAAASEPVVMETEEPVVMETEEPVAEAEEPVAEAEEPVAEAEEPVAEAEEPVAEAEEPVAEAEEPVAEAEEPVAEDASEADEDTDEDTKEDA